MAFDIFFCDDEAEAALVFIPKIKKVFQEYVGNFTITSFKDPVKLLSHMLQGKTCDVLFVDIDMPQMDGITLCSQLQKHNYSIPVVFLSNMEEKVYETFQFSTVYFLRKRCFDEEIEKVARKIFNNLDHKEEVVIFSNGIQNYRIPVKDIKYLEIINQTLYIYLNERVITLRYKMENAESLLMPHGFLRVHKGYLVNSSKISYIQREELKLIDGTRIPVSRRRYNSIKEEFLSIVSKEIRNGE